MVVQKALDAVNGNKRQVAARRIVLVEHVDQGSHAVARNKHLLRVPRVEADLLDEVADLQPHLVRVQVARGILENGGNTAKHTQRVLNREVVLDKLQTPL